MEYFKGNAGLYLTSFTSDETGADEAIGRHFRGSAPVTLATPRRTTAKSTSASLVVAGAPILPQIPLPLSYGINLQCNNLPQPQAAAKLPHLPASVFTSTTPASLPVLLSDHATLLIDIRPSSQYDAERMSPSVPLSVPSTLLKRPLFTLEKLATMMPSKTAMEQFRRWKLSDRIIVVDTESSKLPEMSNVLGLLRKFRIENFAGELLWVQGGFSAISREAKRDRELAKLISSKPVPAPEGVPCGNLPYSAFEQSSTAIAGNSPTLPPGHSRHSSQSARPTLRAHGAALGPANRRVVAANPFYDNIRQLTELGQGITERIPLRIPQIVQDQCSRLPFKWLRGFAVQSESESAEALAAQFYKIELTEQKRLMGIMAEQSRLCNEQTLQGDQERHGHFSITAGIEEGGKNRYRNIWPYEHSRVQLPKSCIASSDYINASHVQPLDTHKRYIATQGPLPESYADFWMMMWDQNVPAIVMLTKRFEGSSVKCGTYWPVKQHCVQRFGDIIATLVSSPLATSEDDAIVPETGLFNFGHPDKDSPNGLIKRMFRISNLREPNVEPREIAHFQYLDWPDHDVPASPQGLLDLMRDVEKVTSDVGAGPVVLHCSAGVGRTGAYILVDAVLDAVRREFQSQRGQSLSYAEASDSSRETGQGMDTSTGVHESPSESTEDVGRSSSKPSCSSLLGTREVSRILSTTDLLPKVVRDRVKGRSKASFASPTEAMSPSPRRDSMPAPVPQLRSISAPNSTASISRQTPSEMPPATVFSSSRKSSLSNAFDLIQPRSTSFRSKQANVISLSMIDEPIRHVLESMREQRMSLCQTLRQFVFAHRAIIEGSLAMMDEPFAEKQAGCGSDSSSSGVLINGRKGHKLCVSPVSPSMPV